MGVIHRLIDVVRSRVHRILDRVEDPRDTLDLTYERQLHNLQKLRRSLAEVATARKRIEIQASRLRQQATKLQSQARAALGQDREDLAREALTRRAALTQQLSALAEQHTQIGVQEEKLVGTSRRVQAQVAAFRTRKETLKATYTAAEAHARVGEAVAEISSSRRDAGATVERAEDKVVEMQARAGAVDELLASGALTDFTSGEDDIEARLGSGARTAPVERELAALRAEIAESAAPHLAAPHLAATHLAAPHLAAPAAAVIPVSKNRRPTEVST